MRDGDSPACCPRWETYLAGDKRTGEFNANVPFHVESVFRRYLKCGILSHGFARACCANCGHDFLIAFSCKGRDICPSCATRRRSPDAPAGARFGAVAFVHRFGSYLNSHVHFHVLRGW